jgi:catechol 2,3-dioxygenase-like lactoylglutathione lyase family enzyme
MQLQNAYPIIVTDKLAECREFYTRWLGFQVSFEASWFVYLASAGDRLHGIAFSGKGMFLTLQVADTAAEFERLQAAGVPVAYPLRDEPWGQRRFALLDPAGVWLDIVQHIDPAPGFWEAHR